MGKPLPERIWLRSPSPFVKWSDCEVGDGVEYVRVDLVPREVIAPSWAALAVCEAMLTLYGPSGEWRGWESEDDTADPMPRLWRMLQAVTNAPRVPDERWAPYEALIREIAARITGRTIDDVSEPLSHLLLSLKHRIHEDVEGMVVTNLCEWEGEDGG